MRRPAEQPKRPRKLWPERAPVTPVQLPILRMLASGMKQKEIAVAVGRSYYTVHRHIESLEWKLGARSMMDLKKYYAENRAVLDAAEKELRRQAGAEQAEAEVVSPELEATNA